MFGIPNQFKKQINQVFNKPDMNVNHAVWLPGVRLFRLDEFFPTF